MSKTEEKIKLKAVGFPDHGASNDEKDSVVHGLKVAQAIQHEWFKADGRSDFYTRKNDFHKRRLYARAEQPTDQYKKQIAVNGDLSYINLDWTPMPIMPKMIDSIINRLSERVFEVKAFAQDDLSASERKNFREMVEGQMIAKDILMDIKKMSGVDPFYTDIDNIPRDNDELELHMQTEYKPGIEIAEEIAINTLLEDNNMIELRRRIANDLTVCGIGVARHDFNHATGVRTRYVDCENWIHSYTDDPYFRDCFYFAEIETVHVTELKKIDPSLTSEDIDELKAVSSEWHQRFKTLGSHGLYNEEMIPVMRFNYKTTRNRISKKKKKRGDNISVTRKDESFNPTQEMLDSGEFEKLVSNYEVWYYGVMPLGSDKLLQWKLEENMVRPKSASENAMPNYVAVAPNMYNGDIDSLGKRAIPIINQLQIIWMKIQQVISRTVPDGVYLDADGLVDIDLGGGGEYGPTKALELYFSTGSVIGRSMTTLGEFNHGKVPVQQLSHSSGSNKLQALTYTFDYYFNRLRDVLGLNEASDASSPSEYALAGVQKLAAISSSKATRHILDGCRNIHQRLAEAMSYRISDIIQYSPTRDRFINQIGRYNVAILDDIKQLPLRDFGIFVEVSPDEEEKEVLERDIQAAIAKENINLEDAIDIRNLKNIKQANQLLKVRRKRKEERDQQIEMQKQAMAAQQNIQAQQMAAQSAMQKSQADTQGKIAQINAETEGRMKILQMEADLKDKLMEKEFNFNMQLKGVEVDAINKREDKKDKAKSDRQKEQATLTSKLQEQKSKGLPSQTFESEEDTLDGIGLEGFGPR